MKTRRGFFEIGIYHPKTVMNMGTLWRSAYQLGASGIFTIGPRFTKQSSDTLKTWRHVPMRHYETFDNFMEHRPYDSLLTGIEQCDAPLSTYRHPERVTYLLGAEDHGLPDNILAKCRHLVGLDSLRTNSYNVAVAGSLVMYDRMTKQGKQS